MSGTLYIVATPIGNLKDLSFRAIEILKKVALVVCEDTRLTRKLLSHYEIEVPTSSYHAQSNPKVVEALIERIQSGEDLAYVTDAGTPMVSDPGLPLVERAIESKIKVVPIPGPSAVTAAISASGLYAARFTFLGFLPRATGERKKLFDSLKNSPFTIVFYESPSRIEKTLRELLPDFGDRRVCVAREISKIFETFYRGTLEEVLKELKEEVKGEIVVLIEAKPEAESEYDEERFEEEARALLQRGERVKDVAKLLSKSHGLSSPKAYELLLKIKERGARRGDDEAPHE